MYIYTSFAIWKPRCVIIHTFVLHTLYLLKVCNFTHLLRKNTPLLITHLSTLHTFPTFTHLLDIHTFLNFTHLLNIHTFLCYTPFEYTHLSQFYTPFEHTHFLCYTPFEYTHLSQVRPNNSILHASIFFKWYIKSIKSISVYFGVQPCQLACIWGSYVNPFVSLNTICLCELRLTEFHVIKT